MKIETADDRIVISDLDGPITIEGRDGRQITVAEDGEWTGYEAPARCRVEELAVRVFALEQRLKSAIGTGDKNVERLHKADEHATRRAVELDNRVTLHDRSIEKLCERLGILSARVTDIEEKDRAREVEKVAVLDRLAEDIAVDEIRKHCAVLATELRNPDPARGWVASELDKLARGGGGETP